MRRRTGMRTYREIGRALEREAAKSAARTEAAARYEPALRACLLEIEQFHASAYPDCAGGCPAHEAMKLAREALKLE